MGNIKNNIIKIKSNIAEAAKKSGRSENDVRLIVVTKTKSIDTIKNLIDIGMKDFGENKVQELTEKMGLIEDDVSWHMIGHLQKNKVKYIAQRIYMIHSVDSIDLATEINKQARNYNRIIDILIQLNISGEETKYGISENEVFHFLTDCSKMGNIKVRGLMTMAPFYAESEEIRKIFSKMYQISLDIRAKNIDNVSIGYLSMGMSNDYIIAVEEGSNMVRIGSAIFEE